MSTKTPTEWVAPPETHQALKELFGELEIVQGRAMNYLRAVGDILKVEPNSRFDIKTMTFYAPSPEPTTDVT